MTWNAASPNGSLSVKDNRTQMNNNNTYIETTMGNTANDLAYSTAQQDHFWNVGSDYSGHHRFIKSPAYTVNGVATDPGPDLGTGMGGILYLKTVKERVQGFFRNANGIYQYIPAFISGTKLISDTYSNLVAVPANVYGEITMWTGALGKNSGQTGFFRSNGTVVEAWSVYLSPQGSGATANLKFGNGSDAALLNIQVRTEAASTGSWNYRITYRAI